MPSSEPFRIYWKHEVYISRFFLFFFKNVINILSNEEAIFKLAFSYICNGIMAYVKSLLLGICYACSLSPWSDFNILYSINIIKY
jgi:hypothetical protein